MTAAESVALAGKMWLYEDDTRTYLGTGTAPGWKDGAGNLEDTNRLLTRNVAEVALAEFRHLVDGPGRHGLVRRSADVGTNAAAPRAGSSRCWNIRAPSGRKWPR